MLDVRTSGKCRFSIAVSRRCLATCFIQANDCSRKPFG